MLFDRHIKRFRDGHTGKVVKYDDRMFNFACYAPWVDCFNSEKEAKAFRKSTTVLKFNHSYEGPICIPENMTSAMHLFSFGPIKKGCYFVESDISSIIDATSMFEHVQFHDDFTLGSMFKTHNMQYMAKMFETCEFHGHFDLGTCFDTSNVIDMHEMFRDAQLSNDFDLGDLFITKNVQDMQLMFYGCEMPQGFRLGKNFGLDLSINHDVMGYAFSKFNDNLFKAIADSNMFFPKEFLDGKSPDDVDYKGDFFTYCMKRIIDEISTDEIELLRNMFHEKI
ncbi:BspA family leucine-rich repeat surface protein [bacterium]|nr:BspA family leucine-rich repeat surface protein [bacterium]